jgi:hypothetical protein
MRGHLLLPLLTALCAAASAQTVANGPYYATPSWDQTLPAATRFVVLSNMNAEAVLDRETGLVWRKTPDPAYVDWATALQNCLSAPAGGRYGWRLPIHSELASLFDPAHTTHQYLPTGHPFVVPGGVGTFWTATRATDGRIRYITYEPIAPSGSILYMFLLKQPSEGGSAWCVRGGSNAGIF